MPIDTAVLLAFIPASLALNLTPGADLLFCLAQGVQGGRRASIAAAIGLALGALIGVTVAGLGLGMVVASNPMALRVLKWLGVSYLLWLALSSLRSRHRAINPGAHTSPFWGGVLIALANPKGLLFVLAFLPQFIDESRPALPQFLFLGAILISGGLLVNVLAGLIAGRAQRTLAGSLRFETVMRRVTATVFGALAVKLAKSTT